MSKYYSNGKLLFTGEYLVLDGAKSLALPTQFGQDLVISPIKEPQLVWGSFTVTGECWFEAVFDLPKLRLKNATFNSDVEGSAEFIAETLQTILTEARKLNPDFLQVDSGFVVKTNLNFPRNWGLGSSSTLINNIASWANVNAYDLLWNAFSGSGYDIACAQNNSPILYQLENHNTSQKPKVDSVEFNPSFKEELFFVYLNKKQNSREGIKRYKLYQSKKDNITIQKDIDEVSMITQEFLNVTSTKDLEKVMLEHERLIASIIQLNPIKEALFSDYFGAVKSLGAWGGDFILATGNEDSLNYFKEKGFYTVVPYSKMIL